jgi:hypothetical protein
MLVGDNTSIEFTGLQQVALPDVGEESQDDGDPMDFGMI